MIPYHASGLYPRRWHPKKMIFVRSWLSVGIAIRYLSWRRLRRSGLHASEAWTGGVSNRLGVVAQFGFCRREWHHRLLAAATCGFVWRDPTPHAPFKGALALTGKAQSSEFSCFLFNLIGLPRRQFRRSTSLASISPDPGRGGPRRDALYPGERRLGGL